MTTTVPAVYAFPEPSQVAAAVADHVIGIQNQTLSSSTGSKAATTNLSPKGLHYMSPSPVPGAPTSTTNSSTNVSSTCTKPTSPPSSPHKRFKIGLSGGSLISVLHDGLLSRKDVCWEKWDIYFADERLVPFSHQESNYGLLKRSLLDELDPSQGMPRVFHIDENLINDAQEAADNYEKVLIRGFAAKDSVKLPMFDLLLLGCAPDGHTCSLFPNHALLRENLAWVAPIEDAPRAPSRRITLMLPVICHSHHVSFVVEGLTKAPVVKTIMERPEKGLPSSLVNEGAAGKVSWFVDNEALQGVSVMKKEYKFLAPKV